MRIWWVLALQACGFKVDSGPPSDAATVGDTHDARPADAAIDATIDAPPPMCPSNYEERAGSRYRYVSTTAPWAAAESDCENDSSGLTHLVVLGTGELPTVDAISSASRTWVGLSDLVTDGTWLWVTGATGPSLGTGSSSCAELDDGGTFGGPQLREDDCTTGRSYVCECDLTPANPATF